MNPAELSFWLLAAGLGAMWLGVQIVVVGRLPRALRKGPTPTAPKGTPEAFGLFWIDQYGYIGLTLAIVGGCLALAGLVS